MNLFGFFNPIGTLPNASVIPMTPSGKMDENDLMTLCIGVGIAGIFLFGACFGLCKCWFLADVAAREINNGHVDMDVDADVNFPPGAFPFFNSPI
ncbi:MAG: hypothetical protein ACD_42C00608G0001 [uncultured bacterium]|nr:MAG: hypothetical protein ACD_42C00608G0001 [uncultured bacterium]OGT26770.1 MAG: hypothetical protein A3B71_03980 [Gammaproteobacteria bacterium RIFCSPHIGHO2_02_FULL_42_43]OGT28651.1 MAG: hypothetical protein A2624_06625 [Gammaproteobacteria bacterium RIFCSPHIGHO2_01_FULL_42_8]OGT52922.1 MAG: hypothetical protein A3E54_07545 [Gammaproteobacteria bacterium RIFCSPHIGHO2_12_FULL_41_25]OGT61304.1 MAG: hypothetical protein A3I77_08145 [Gammaproteobacteria bacterium RIFCSPLOWO2_02_FULL_42_14]OGT